MKFLLLNLRDWFYKQHCKKCSCYKDIRGIHSFCLSEVDCKYNTWCFSEGFKDELFKEDKECKE